jgi:hypothetical protein
MCPLLLEAPGQPVPFVHRSHFRFAFRQLNDEADAAGVTGAAANIQSGVGDMSKLRSNPFINFNGRAREAMEH